MDYSKLRGKIKEKGLTEKEFSKMLGMAAATFSGKIKGISFFNTEEIKKAIQILDLSETDIYEYFFKEKTE